MPLRRMVIQISLVLFLLTALGGQCLCQDPQVPKPQPVSGQDRANENQKGTGLKIDAGLRRLLSARSDAFHYRIEYNGNVFADKGTAFTDSLILQQPTVNIPEPEADSYDFLFRMDRGVGNFTGPVFDALKVTNLNSVALRDFRGAAQVFGKLDGKKVDVAGGLEYKALHFLPMTGTAANYFIPGIQQATQTNDAAENGDDRDDQSQLTYRAFIGSAIGKAVKSDQLIRLEDAMRVRFSEHGPTYADLRANIYRKKLRDDPNLADSDKRLLWLRMLQAAASGPIVRSQSEVDPDQFVMELRTRIQLGPNATAEESRNADLVNRIRDSVQRVFDNPPAPGGGDAMPSEVPAAVARIRQYVPGTGGQQIHADIAVFLNHVIRESLLGRRTPAQARQFMTDLGFLPDDPLVGIADMSVVRVLVEGSGLTPVELRNVQLWERMFANRLLLERAYPSIRGVSGRDADASVWRAKTAEFLKDAFYLPDRSTANYWVEGAGQYTFIGPSIGSRFYNLFAVTLTYYLNPKADQRNWIRFRFENGRDRAQPEEYKNLAVVSLGADF